MSILLKPHLTPSIFSSNDQEYMYWAITKPKIVEVVHEEFDLQSDFYGQARVVTFTTRHCPRFQYNIWNLFQFYDYV